MAEKRAPAGLCIRSNLAKESENQGGFSIGVWIDRRSWAVIRGNFSREPMELMTGAGWHSQSLTMSPPPGPPKSKNILMMLAYFGPFCLMIVYT